MVAVLDRIIELLKSVITVFVLWKAGQRLYYADAR